MVIGPDFNWKDLKRSLGLSTKSLIHRLKDQPEPVTHLPGFVRNFKKVERYSKGLKHAGYVGLALDVTGSVADIAKACTAADKQTCARSAFGQGGRFAGSLLGGAGGGLLAGYVTCTAIFLLPTGSTSAVWCGIVAGAAGGYVGGNVLGHYFLLGGEVIYEMVFEAM